MDSEPTLRQAGVVRSVADGRAVIAVAAQGCPACGRRDGCGIGRLSPGERSTLLEIPVSEPLSPGDSITLALSECRLLGAALAGYLLPACLLILGAGLGEASGGDAFSVLGALAGLAAGILAGRRVRSHAAPILLKRG